MPVTREAHLGKAHEEVDHTSVVPAVKMVGQIDGLLVVMQRDQRLDALLLHVRENVIVELEARLQRLLLGARGEEARPLDRESQRLEAHLGKKVDVLAPAMIEVHSMTLGVAVRVRGGLGLLHLCVGDAVQRLVVGLVDVGLVGCAVSNREALTSLVPAALVLVCGRRSTPQEPLWKPHVLPFRCL